MKEIDEVKQILNNIYGDKKGKSAFERILPIIQSFEKKASEKKEYFSQEDIILITYGDSLNQNGICPLNTLHQFAVKYFKNIFSTIHILPFFPFSSDDGFSVIDFSKVDPLLGTWGDINAFRSDFRLMFDYVLNHVSAKSQWFENYLEEKDPEKHLAIEVNPAADLSDVTRPRALPLLTEYTKKSGNKVHVWTTFSADQIDLNFKSLDVLEKMISVLLYYVEQGATILRLDAIAYLWKEIGTSCIHLPQTHMMVKLFRKILDIVAPSVLILTETNVPHEENISYFGNGRDEAQMVYNFTLPPLLFYTFVKQNSNVLFDWAKSLEISSKSNTFFNFTASHDGIGVRPLEGVLPRSEIATLAEMVRKNEGNVSYKRNPDGTQSPYELNITYIDAMEDKRDADKKNHIKRFLACQAIQYVLTGVPATYIHSILGSRNWTAGVRQTKRYRTINREKLQIDTLLPQLKYPGTFRSQIFYPYLDIIKIRKNQPAFHPKAGFKVLDINSKVFGILRFCDDQQVYSVTNISSEPVTVSLPEKAVPSFLTDLITGERFNTQLLNLTPYQYVWLSSPVM